MKRIFLIAGLFALTSFAFAEDLVLLVQDNNYQDFRAYELNIVKKITFENGQIIVTKNDGTKDYSSISDINRLHFGAAPLAIDEITDENDNRKNTYYDMQGRQVKNPIKGLYIINKKKVLIK